MPIHVPGNMDIHMEFWTCQHKLEEESLHLLELNNAYEAAGRYCDEEHAKQWKHDILEATNYVNLLAEHLELLNHLISGGEIELRQIV